MKKILKTGRLLLIIVLFLSIFFSSCEKIIDVQPFNQISEDVAFTSPDLIALSVTGMYNAAQLGYYNNAPRGYPFGAAFVEQGDCRGEDVVNTATFYQITYQATYTTVSTNNVWMWSDTYRLINRCNIVIEGVKKAGIAGTIPAAKANEYEAEARLLRALSYHELLIHFARPYKETAAGTHPGVPYHEIPNTTLDAVDAGLLKSRSTVAEVYTKILADLDFAEANLPLKAARTASTKITRANRGAAIAAKTRIYLHLWDMDKVITEGSKMVAGGALATEYTLTADPSGPFMAPYTNTESILGMESSANYNPGVNAALGAMYNNRNLVCISPIIWRNAKWLTDDKRRTESNMVKTSTAGIKYTNKYKDVTTYTDPSPMMRYAEVLLNLAEAYARKNDVTNGLIYLNMVRNRSLAAPATQAYTAASFATNIDLLAAILVEKRIEFVMEGRRWSDISRLQKDPNPTTAVVGIPGKLANGVPAGTLFTLGTEYTGALGTGAIPYADYRFIWPIPQDEINANPTLAKEQAPGY